MTDPRLEALREAGAETFDGPGFRFVEGLLQRSVGLKGKASEMLLRRANARLVRLQAEFVRARKEAESTVARLVKAKADGAHYTALFAAGDFKAIQRQAPSALRAAQQAKDAYAARALRLANEAAARGMALEAEDQARVAKLQAGAEAPKSDRALGDRLAQALFRDTAQSARGALVLARAAADVPAVAGPYNPQALAVQALELAEALSPAYLRAYLRDLESLAVLRGLPAPARRRRR